MTSYTPRGYSARSMKKEVAKLHKVNGQIIHLARMIEEKENCEKTIIQFQAAKGALNRVFYDFLDNNLKQCIRRKMSKEFKSIIKEVAKK